MKINDINSNNHYFSTLKDCSLDDKNSDYMLDSQKKIINFDVVKDDYVKQKCTFENDMIFNSSDGLFKYEDKYYLIEFKNGNLLKDNKSNAEKIVNLKKTKEIRHKIADSCFILMDIANISVEELRKNTEFILVYNGDKNDVSQLGKEIPGTGAALLGNIFANLAQKKYIQFGLESCIGMYFSDLHTVTVKEFERDFAFIGV